MLDPAGSAPIPRGKAYEHFLHNTENKRQFFSFCSKQLCYHLSLITEKLIITTYEEKVLSKHDLDLSMLQPCNHAEADTRIILHLFHAASEWHKFALVRTVHSDVVILCLFFFVKLGFVELWVIFGVGKSICHIPHNLYVQLGLMEHGKASSPMERYSLTRFLPPRLLFMNISFVQSFKPHISGCSHSSKSRQFQLLMKWAGFMMASERSGCLSG